MVFYCWPKNFINTKTYSFEYKNKKSFNFRIDFENNVEAHGIGFNNYSFDIFEIEAYNQNSRINIMDCGYYLEYYNLKEDVVSYPDIVNKDHDK